MLRLTIIAGRNLAFCVSCLLVLVCLPATLAAEERADARVLIDVSGSMKENDPQNLRRPALRLLVGLLPADARAGVWTFGQYINAQVPLGQVNDSWKQRARKGVEKIHSRGLFTNIEEALLRATKDWTAPDPEFRRHVILLTDGMVDVSKVPEESAASRQRIIKEILPRLKKLGVQVHTIALSERADHELMKKLSITTGGWYEQVNDADRLKRVFLRIFEKVGRPDTLPLKGNRFKVDASIDEVTLLVFHNPAAAAPTRLVTPSGKRFGVEDVPANVAWFQDAGYDLLTIEKPEVGRWKVEAEMDPDNRVMVVTDLKMKGGEIPNLVAIGENVPLNVQFTEQGRQITRKEFLNVINIKSEQRIGKELTEPQPLYDDGVAGDAKADDGIFSAMLGAGWAEGQVELIVTATGKTFMREQRQTFRVRKAAVLEVAEQTQDGHGGVKVQVIPDSDVIDPVGIETQAWLQKSGGAREGFILTPEGEGIWSSWLDTSGFSDSRSLRVSFVAQSHAGNPVKIDLGPVDIMGTELKVADKAPPEQPVEAEVSVDQAPADEGGGVDTLVMVGAGNLALLVLGGAGFWFWRRSRRQQLVQLIDEADEDIEEELETEVEEEVEPESPEAEVEEAEAKEAEPETALEQEATTDAWDEGLEEEELEELGAEEEELQEIPDGPLEEEESEQQQESNQ